MNAKLMTPIFYNGMFNQDGRRMRAVFEQEVSNGTDTYRLWRGTGKPDQEYPRAQNDAYLLYVEQTGYLIPLGITEYTLVDHCGFEAMVRKIYGNKENRSAHFGELRKLGQNADEQLDKTLAYEREEILRLGISPVFQADYIKALLNQHISTYQTAKENGGESFPDFIGALMLNDLEHCVELATIYKEKNRRKRLEEQVKREAEEQVYCEAQNRMAEQAVADALHILRTGGVLKNNEVCFYQSRYNTNTYSMINYLMRQFKVDVPLRTQGWINKKLASITIEDGKCEHLTFMSAKGCRCSQKVFQHLNALIGAVQKA